jgi:hypothetical protein
VPNFAGSWSGTVMLTSQGTHKSATEQLSCTQHLKTVSCTATGELVHGSADYIKGKIDTRGHLNFSVRDKPRSAVTGTGTATIKRGHLNSTFNGHTSDGAPLTGTATFTKVR